MMPASPTIPGMHPRIIVTPVMFRKVDTNPSKMQPTISTAPPGICSNEARMPPKPKPLMRALMKLVTEPFRMPYEAPISRRRYVLGSTSASLN